MNGVGSVINRRIQKVSSQRALICAEYYDILIGPLRYVAERCGYALAVHGSLARDIDLIACPWRDSCISAHKLIPRMRAAVIVIIGMARIRDVDRASGQPEIKPCGRLAWTFYLTYEDDGPYLDISVMPKVAPISSV